MAAITALLFGLCISKVFAVPTARASDVASTTCNGKTYVYHELAGYGFTPSNARDKFGDTAGGIGSSAAIDIRTWQKKGDTYTGVLYALPDRGWNTEGTLNFQPRYHKFGITFTPNTSATAANPSPPNLKLNYLDTIRFSENNTPFSGLDPDAAGPYLTFGQTSLPSSHYTGNGFGGSGPGGNRPDLDSEGIVLNPDGSTWVSDEYGAYIYHFSPTGQLLSTIAPPPAVIPRRNGTVSFSAASPPRYDPNITITPKNPVSGRSNNQGLEGLTASADGKSLWALMQSALTQEGGTTDTGRRYARLFKYDISNPSKPIYAAEYIVPLPKFQNQNSKTRIAAQSEIKFISDTQFLILARDSGAGHGQDRSQSLYRHADVFDISAATNIKGQTFDCATCAIADVNGTLKAGLAVAEYCPFLDFNVNDQLARFGLHNGGEQDSGLLNEKWESFALVPVNPKAGGGGGNWGDWSDGSGGGNGGKQQDSDEYFLFSLSDNDFVTQDGYMNGGQLPYADESGYNLDNQVLVFRVGLPKGSRPRLG